MIIGCGTEKRDHPAPAGEFYRSQYFREARFWAHSIDAQVIILSARHGLLDERQVILPYSTTWGSREAVSAADLREQADHLGLHGPIVTLAGERYARRIRRATDIEPILWFVDESRRRGDSGGLGFQRHLFRLYLGRVPEGFPP